MASHPIVHIEFPGANTKEVSSFYAKAFDWKLTHAGEFDYWMFDPGAGPGGGFTNFWMGPDGKMMEFKPSEVLVYIGTDDIEASLAKVEEAGGTILAHKTEIPGNGWFGIFNDPNGNRVALYTAISES